MNLHEALKTALSREIQIRDHYAQGAKAIQDPKGRRVFETLAKEEQGHVDYLEHRLWELEKSGKVESPALETILPSRERLAKSVSAMDKTAPSQVAVKAELDLVKAALESLYATEQSLVSLIPLDKLTSYVASIVSTVVGTFNKLGWFQKSAGTTAA